jgi:hypothetical protein
LKTGRFNRILLLVDSAGGGQIPDVFKDVIIENHITLEQIYHTKTHVGTGTGRDAKFHV